MYWYCLLVLLIFLIRRRALQ
ncbi:hypothetical protein EYY90_03570 [Hafnia alvei]|nr:hypothetical protein EYY90_03570 [Hafnia alvei]